MATFIIAQIRDMATVLGLRVATLSAISTGKGTVDVSDIRLNDAKAYIKDSKFYGATLDVNENVELSYGTFNTLPVLNAGGTVLSKCGLFIMYAIVDDKDNIVGYGVTDTYGVYINMSESKVIEIQKSYNLCNFEVYLKPDGTVGVRSKKGKFPKIALSKVTKTSSNPIAGTDAYEIKTQSANGNSLKVTSSATEIPTLVITGVSKEFLNSNSNGSAQRKLLEISDNLRKVSPYYHVLFEVIPRIPTDEIPTMGVTEDTFYYNPKMVEKLSVAEGTFIIIHEVLHIALQHSIRQGNKNAILWNVVCDLYINELICRDFDINYYDEEKKLPTGGSIKAYSNGVYLATINETFDYASETTESVYQKMYIEAKEEQGQGQQGQGQKSEDQSQQGESGQQGSQGQGQQSQDQSGQGQEGEQGQGQQGQGQQGQGQQGQGQQGQQGQGQQGQGQQGQGQQGQGQGQQGQGQQGQGQGQQGQGQQGQQNQNDLGEDLSSSLDKGLSDPNLKDCGDSKKPSSLQENVFGKNPNAYTNTAEEVTVIYKGKKLTVRIPLDIMSNNDRSTGSVAEVEKAQQQTLEVLNRIIVKKELAEEGTDKMGMSSGSELVEREIRFATRVKYDWKKVLQNICQKSKSTTYSYSKPNVRYSSLGTMPGKMTVRDTPVLKGVKVAVDVSGSIGQAELDAVYTEVSDILKRNSVEDAEIIFWDTCVTNAGHFNNMQTLLKVKPLGSGGTNVNAVFSYLAGETRSENGIKEQTRPSDISVILIFTDGYVSHDYEKYMRAFGRKVIWVISDKTSCFDSKMGIVAVRAFK